MSLIPVGEGTSPTIKRPSHRPPAAIRTAKRFPLEKGGMHDGVCDCRARGERGTGKTGNKTPSNARSVPVPMQQSAVQPILSWGKFSLHTHTAHKTRESIRC